MIRLVAEKYLDKGTWCVFEGVSVFVERRSERLEMQEKERVRELDCQGRVWEAEKGEQRSWVVY